MGGYVSVDVDVDDILDALCDDQIIKEVQTRKLEKHFKPKDPTPVQPYVMDYFELAHEALLQGRAADAIAFLERGLFPTGVEKTASGKLKYRHAMA